MSEQASDTKLRLREKIFYGLGDVSNGLAVSSMSLWFLYYLTDVAGLGAFLAGIAITVGRLWDAVTDPIMGWITDHTKSRWGKRLPYLLFGAIPYAISYLCLWIVPEFESEHYIFVYVTVTLIFFNTCLTVVFVPYTSLTAAITNDYNERTSITGYRMFSSQVAFLIGAALPPILVSLASHSAQSEQAAGMLESLIDSLNPLFGSWANTARQGHFIVASLFAVIMVASIWTTFFGTREREFETKARDDAASQSTPFTYASKIVEQLFGNKPFLISVLMLLLANCAAALAGANLAYYLQYVLGLEADFHKIIPTMFIMAIVSVPIWVTLAKKYGKAEVFQKAMYCYALIYFLMPLFQPEYNRFIYIVAMLIGFFHAAALTIPWAVIPDVVEYDELKSGKRREGLFYGGTTFAYKAATGMAILISSIMLEVFNYTPNTVQSPNAILAIKFLIGPIPAVFLLAAAFLAGRYPLTYEKHKRILAELAQRKQEAGALDS